VHHNNKIIIKISILADLIFPSAATKSWWPVLSHGASLKTKSELDAAWLSTHVSPLLISGYTGDTTIYDKHDIIFKIQNLCFPVFSNFHDGCQQASGAEPAAAIKIFPERTRKHGQY